MKEWRLHNMKLGNRIAASRDSKSMYGNEKLTQEECEELRSRMISKRQVRTRFNLTGGMPSGLLMNLFERIGLIKI